MGSKEKREFSPGISDSSSAEVLLVPSPLILTHPDLPHRVVVNLYLVGL